MTKESVTDKPVTRVSLKERLENMKQKVAGMDKHEKVKEKEEVILKKFTTMLLQILQLPNTIKIEKYD